MNQSEDKTRKILYQWMNSKGIKNYLELSRKSQVSELQFYRLEHNLIDNIPLGILKKIAFAFDISLQTLIDNLTTPPQEISCHEIEKDLKQECERLLKENEQLKQNIIREYQRDTITILESLLLQLPTINYAIKNNPEIPATRLLPLMQPVQDLLRFWGIETIGEVGETVKYDPQIHELMEDTQDDTQIFEMVKIRYVGYRQGEDLLYRAKVSPIVE
ncbi:helix-turn-helix domain-containing protein [Cyanobacterium aponinum UTEX 3222]|uniref:Helix-turn-helix domain-containing protein n=2 Tax=Cyanobacterium aponinum TaxID=379064 RepID=A0A844GUI8_9CHRO|nr:helix-turn-helix domain-containing protein [Cyanobacterium aponinum]WRL40716.1 helix-turn-helix domain-containing protein [Cyanobacterium aponinum UTEX 3222]MBD2392911.1 helix-turn-helix domain-containing protein [Cyanobacterium aponinum FACHB-4101]MTF37905.1 helix-turn-helix domain-containing protein [Cyanobacterium aponinum 0216]PHV62293.1 XRE family transcriptional regulator [Cyanobacterium aponinum IPPAS B-1201]WPF87060.1 helix-turn-helix domain-containing protein [Cyanobacterium aponin